MLQRLVFEMEYLAPAGALAATLIAGFIANRAGKGKTAVTIWALGVLLAAGLAASTRLVETTREQITRLSQTFVAAVASGDDNTAAPLISERLTVAAGDTLVTGYDKQALVSFIPTVPSYVNDSFQSVSNPTADNATASADAFVRVLGGMGTGTYDFTLRWAREADAWRLTRIDLNRVNGEPPPTAWVTRWMR